MAEVKLTIRQEHVTQRDIKRYLFTSRKQDIKQVIP